MNIDSTEEFKMNESSDKYELKLQNAHSELCTKLAFFDPAEGHVPNPGMGIIAFAYSDHMHVGYTMQEWKATESNPPMQLKRETFNKMIAIPYADNIYIRMEWRDIQKEKGKVLFSL